MPITETHDRYPGAFDAIYCPICGCEEFFELRHEGVFCTECNCHVSLRPTAGDPGFVADFDAGYCWTDTPEADRFPADSEGRRTAFAKYGGSSENYYRVYFTLAAEFDAADAGVSLEEIRAWYDARDYR